MKRLSFLIILLPVLVLTATAQKKKITSGALNFENGEYADAITALEEGLANRDQIKRAKHVAKGQYYLAKAYYQVSNDSSLLALYPDAPVRAKQYYDELMANEDGKTWQNRATVDFLGDGIWGQLYNQGVNLFNSNEDEKALEYFIAAKELNPEHFLTNRMLGAAYIVMKDSAGAIDALQTSIQSYKDRYLSVSEEELNGMLEDQGFRQQYELDRSQMSYVIRQLAVVHEAQGRTNEALQVLSDGGEMFPNDEDIARQELGIYQNHPDLYEQAVAKFERQLENNPNDNQVRLAYASMLERAGNFEEALELYQDAHEQDPSSLQANYGLAAMRINQAAELSEAKMESNDDDEIAAYDEQIKQLCEEAYPYLIKLHELQPNEPEWLSQLVNITPLIGKTEEMQKWAEKLGKMRRAGE